jgi:hypothetical protein
MGEKALLPHAYQRQGGKNMNRIFGMDSPLVETLMKVGDCLCLSVLWLVFSLPVFTIGASSTALYATVHACFRRS